MAQAVVSPIIWVAGKGHPTQQRVGVAVYFWGPDVPDAMDGQSFTLDVYLPVAWTLASLKAQLVDAVMTKAVAMGLSLTAANVYVVTRETGLLASTQVLLDASKLTGLSETDPVATWADLSGNGYDAAQATASFRPIYKTSGINGLPVVRYDGSDDVLIVSLSLAQPCSVVLVMKHLTGTVAGNQSLVLGSASGAGLFCRNVAPAKISLYAGSGTLDGASLDTNPHVVSAVMNGASSLIAVDGVVTTGNIGTSGLTSTIYVGGSGPPCLNGDLGEVMLFNTALSSADRHSYEVALGTKWGVSVA